MDDSFAGHEQADGHRWGGREILHAALIFDPGFTPTPINYQLPKRDRPSCKETDSRSRSANDQEKDHGGSMGNGRNARTYTVDVQGVRLNLQPQLLGKPTHEATPSDHLRWKALPYRNGLSLDGLDIKHDSAMESFKVSPVNASGRFLGFLHIASYHSDDDDSLDDGSFNASVIDDEQNSEHYGRVAVTDEELELLDYDGTRGRRGNDALYTCTGRAASVGPEECSDGDSKTGTRMRWSL